MSRYVAWGDNSRTTAMDEKEIVEKMKLIHHYLNGDIPKEKWTDVLDYLAEDPYWLDILLFEMWLRYW